MLERPRFRESVRQAKEQLAQGREKLLQQHRRGALGIQVCSVLSDLMDRVITDVVRAAVSRVDPDLEERIALVPHGGYGRRDMSPFSDIDLMLLHQTGGVKLEALAAQLAGDLSDLGLALGFSVRTPSQACQLAGRDAKTYASLVDARLLMGSTRCFDRFQHQFRRTVRRHARSLLAAVEAARAEERVKYGETVYLLEPNIKRSPGGLRDVQLLRWTAFARYGESDLDHLRRQGLLLPEDQRKVRDANEFLLRVRHEMHFHAGATRDVVTRQEQLRLAEWYGFRGAPGRLPVEQFMQEYFRHTSAVQAIVEDFISAARWRRRLSQTVTILLGRRIDHGLKVGPSHIHGSRRAARRLAGDMDEVLRLVELANHYNKQIDPMLWRAVRSGVLEAGRMEVGPAAKQRFLSLLSQPARLGPLLRRLHQLHLLEKLVPGFDHARCLLQFNDYHKYTVDEHCIRAVECVTEFARRPGPLGRNYRAMSDKRILHLALLIHDLGKGFPEDHSELGRLLALRVADHLNLSDRERDHLEFLVHKHLMLNHLAFRRDTSDEQVLLDAAVQIGSPVRLRMLYLLTCADLAAVGPGVLNDWKVEVLTELFRRLMDRLSGGTSSPDSQQRAWPQRQQLLERVAGHPHAAWLQRQIASLPLAYLGGATAEQLLADLERMRTIAPGEAIAWARYLEDRQVVEYSVAGHESIASGIFHRLTGALSSQGLQILSAEIHSLADSLFLDRFYVDDPDYRGRPPDHRFEDVTEALVAALKTPGPFRPSFRVTWQDRKAAAGAAGSSQIMPTQVKIDNATSDLYTIIDVFAHDRTGLLFAIARTIYELGLSVRIAKIGTYLDQVVDVFYVSDAEGGKVQDEGRLAEIRTRIFQAIEQWNQTSSAARGH